jgi:hypothetical protein
VLCVVRKKEVLCHFLTFATTHSIRTNISKFHQNLTTTSDTLIRNHSSNNTDHYLRSKHNYFIYNDN